MCYKQGFADYYRRIIAKGGKITQMKSNGKEKINKDRIMEKDINE